MRRKVHQVKEELFQEFSKENGKDNNKLMELAAKFNRLDAAVQLQQETAQLEFRAAEENHKGVNSKTRGELWLLGDAVPTWRTTRRCRAA